MQMFFSKCDLCKHRNNLTNIEYITMKILIVRIVMINKNNILNNILIKLAEVDRKQK